MTAQPSYFCIANLGDVNPFEYGGAFVCIDRRGIYDPILLIYDEDFHRRSEITLVRCHKIVNDDGNFLGVGTNRFHPKHKEWFSDELETVAEYYGWNFQEFTNSLTSQHICERAHAYEALVSYHGIYEFDQDPFIYESEDDGKKFCDKMLAQIKESEAWHDGYFAKSDK